MTNFEIRYKLCHVRFPNGYDHKSVLFSASGRVDKVSFQDAQIWEILRKHQDTLTEEQYKQSDDLMDGGFFYKDVLELIKEST